MNSWFGKLLVERGIFMAYDNGKGSFPPGAEFPGLIEIAGKLGLILIVLLRISKWYQAGDMTAKYG